MMDAPPAYWLLTDLAATGDLADEYKVGRATISNWTVRYPDFPAPVIELSTGPAWSRWQVRQWRKRRWPGQQ
jgi:hypothetical protein